MYPGTQHGFNNDTTPRYDKAAAGRRGSARSRSSTARCARSASGPQRPGPARRGSPRGLAAPPAPHVDRSSRATGRGSSRSIPSATPRRSSTPTRSTPRAATGPTCRSGRSPTFEDYRAWLRTMAAGDDPLFYAIVDRATRRAGRRRELPAHRSGRRLDRGRAHQLLAAACSARRAATEAMYLMMRARLRRARLPPLRVEVRRAERAVARRRRAAGLHLRGHLPPGHGLQGPQPRHGVVLDHRSRVPGARPSVRSLARSRQLRRRRHVSGIGCADLIAASRPT